MARFQGFWPPRELRFWLLAWFWVIKPPLETKVFISTTSLYSNLSNFFIKFSFQKSEVTLGCISVFMWPRALIFWRYDLSMSLTFWQSLSGVRHLKTHFTAQNHFKKWVKTVHVCAAPVKPAPPLQESFYNESLIFLSIDMGTPIKNMSIPVFGGLRSSGLKVAWKSNKMAFFQGIWPPRELRFWLLAWFWVIKTPLGTKVFISITFLYSNLSNFFIKFSFQKSEVTFGFISIYIWSRDPIFWQNDLSMSPTFWQSLSIVWHLKTCYTCLLYTSPSPRD